MHSDRASNDPVVISYDPSDQFPFEDYECDTYNLNDIFYDIDAEFGAKRTFKQ